MMLLGDGNDLVQDAASKGLGIVYEACSAEQRDAMVGNLLQTLLEGNKGTQKVDKDSKIFGEGQLGKAPTGENLTTYKELCSLASDLNQPDLVYKFMNLANHNAGVVTKEYFTILPYVTRFHTKCSVVEIFMSFLNQMKRP